MITLKKMAALVHRILDGGQSNTDSEYDFRYTMSLIRSSINETLAVMPFKRRGESDDRTQEKMYIATYPKIEVKYDTATERCFADLPDTFASQSYNRGIHQVSAMDKPLEPMIQKLNPTVSGALPCGGLQGRVGFYSEGLRIFWDTPIKEIGFRKVIIKLIIAAPSSLGEDDPLPITPGQENVIRDRVIEMYRGEGIQDKVVDSNKDIGTNVTAR